MSEKSNSSHGPSSYNTASHDLSRYVSKIKTAVEQNRPRINLDGSDVDVNPTGLIEMQLASYADFLQREITPDDRALQGLHAAFQSVFPIASANEHIVLEYLGYDIGETTYDVNSCLLRGKTYSAPLQVKLRLVVYDKEQLPEKKVVKNIKEQTVYMGELPVMTPSGSFIINGSERVVVSQLHRSPGVFFEHDKGKSHSSKKLLYSGRIIPYRGAWFDIEFDVKNLLFVRIDRRRKLPVTVILKALGLSKSEILDLFYDYDKIELAYSPACMNSLAELDLSTKALVKRQGEILDESCELTVHVQPERMKGQLAPVTICDDKGNEIVAKGRRISKRHIKLMQKHAISSLITGYEHILGKILAEPLYDKETGEELHEVNTVINHDVVVDIITSDIKSVNVLSINDTDRGPYISDTLRVDTTDDQAEALVEIYRVMRPGEPPAADATRNLFQNLFFSNDRYDLSEVGRMKFNKRLNIEQRFDSRVLSKEDIISTIQELVNIRNGNGVVDDIDNLANRRVRRVGEMVENQFRSGLERTKRSVLDRFGYPDSEGYSPQEVFNAKPVVAALHEFFGSSQMSQFMDATNPLSVLAIKRRVTALGPGGLSRDRANMEVRDVHHTHYGRICPIQTPEGPNIGLINALAIFAKINRYGFIETPVRKVVDGKVTDQVDYVSAIEEGDHHIAQSSCRMDPHGKLQDDFVTCRHQRDFVNVTQQKIDYVDISPRQIVSVAASLIPFLEHNDANRALMGSNMQRQAVPLLKSEKPLVGTGMERVVASDSGVSMVAKRAGKVESVDASRVIIRTDDGSLADSVDVYKLTKFSRSNNNTCVDQRPIVEEGAYVAAGDVIADGPSTDFGELALGQNLLVAFMSWNGYNFEDSIIISERVVSDDRFTSIHVQELSSTARDTKLGPEEVTADIPNISESALSKLDENGIVYVGAKVEPGDILVGKITPKGEALLSPEEKLLRAIFGDKASDVKDSSLRVPAGVYGTITDVQIFSREGVERDQRYQDIIKETLDDFKKDRREQLALTLDQLKIELSSLLKGKTTSASKSGVKRDTKLTDKVLAELTLEKMSSLEVKGDKHLDQQAAIVEAIQAAKVAADADITRREERLMKGDDLAPGVIKVVKVFLATKRKLQPGDKMAGRHGNKGCVSVIVPEEDMPYMEDGRVVDVILNPLGVPSRMNVGQILETHLGWAGKELGAKIAAQLDANQPKSAYKLLGQIDDILGVAPAQKKQLTERYTPQALQRYRDGIPFSSPVFNRTSEEKIKQLLSLAGLPESGQTVLIDGRTGEPYDRPVTVGYKYILKLHHLVDEKMHSRSTGSYSLVTQQPLGGKAQGGGQRFGEMEVWALQAYGAAHVLQEMLTVKSDDVMGRTRMYKNIIDNNLTVEASTPEVFNVMVKEVRSLALDIHFDHEDVSKVTDLFDFTGEDEEKATQDTLSINILSPEKIRAMSYGEVKKPETINYRTFKPERDGLFCAKIFGPMKDYECLCGKYKRMKHRGVVCEKCGVEVTLTKVRRERMGHITLACPVAHIWFLKSLPSRIGLLLDMNLRDIERVLYFESYIVVNPGMTDLKEKQLLSEDAYVEAVEQYGDDFVAMMGAEAIKEILDTMNIELEITTIREQIESTSSETRLKRLIKRARILESIAKSSNKASWMILTELPVLPPDLRPLVPLDGGRFATSDLNDLYRRVINRNNRLKRLLEMAAPEIIVRNEKRMLQESVDALFDNGRRGRAITGTNKRPLKSLADMIKGKSGRFRQNLLGKRVDYSGRSVIVVGPTLKLHQCGIPKRMALELFKPFIFSRLQRLDLCTTIKSAKQMVENEEPPVWDALDEVIKEHPVMLNRAPTLHRLGIQAFEPILVEGKAIQVHPLVCKAYNADFDGDTMSVHVPLSIEAQLEARCLMMSTNNILSPANGKPIIVPDKDVVLGLYYLTKERVNALGEGMVFNNCDECRRAYYVGFISLHAKVKVRMNPDDSNSTVNESLVETTAGRIIFWDIIPSGIAFDMINRVMKSGDVSNLIHACVHQLGPKQTVVFADQFMYLGFKYAGKSGISIGIDDLMIPTEKANIVEESETSVREIEEQFASGLLTNGERYNKIVDTWTHAGLEVEKAMKKSISTEAVKASDGKTVRQDSFNSIYMMADSGARGSVNQMRQLVGMRGLMTRPDGSFIETAVTSNFKEGLNVMQYFTSTHGARKGLADTALKTASSGYLTRRLVDVAQDVVIVSQDCGTEQGIEMLPHIQGGEVVEGLRERVMGRVLSKDIIVDDQVLLARNTLLGDEELTLLEHHGIDRIYVRSPILCELKSGICAMCYGRDLARGCMVNVGEAVGVIAAQSIGEPGTQLSMRTFHIGGAASRATAENSIQVRSAGTVRLHDMKTITHRESNELIAISRSGMLALLDAQGRECERYKVPYGTTLKVKDGDLVKSGATVAEWDPYTHPIIAEVSGKVDFVDFIEGVTITRQTDELTGLSTITVLQDQTASKDARAMVRLIDKAGDSVFHPGTNVPANYFLSAGSIVNLEQGHEVGVGDVIARIPKEGYKTTDITGGLPRVSDIFEARKPKDAAILAEISGVVSMGKETKDKKRLTITDVDGNKYEELIPKWRSITVFEGESVERGDVVVDGQDDPHAILRLKGVIELARYIINEVQDVYRLQGVGINDKHIEIIIRQMLRKVLVKQPGGLGYLSDELIEKSTLNDEIQAAVHKNPDVEMPVIDPVLQGITKSSLSTESFISAASFQETTRVLTEASINGSKDMLVGLKENVLVGRLIPAGTGFKSRTEREPENAQFDDESDIDADAATG